MTTVTIQIGNTDNKLTQYEWHIFVARVTLLVNEFGQVHFFAASEGTCAWQNCAWVILLHKDSIDDFKTQLKEIRGDFKQDSVAWTEGETQFV